MEKIKRKLFFWALVITFLVVAPVVIMRARGYRFDLNRGVFVHSGTISVKSNPQNIKVLVDGKPVESNLNRINNSYNISGLIPDNYDLSIQADGFQTWSKKIDVHSGVASEFWNVLLVRLNYEDTSYSTGGLDNFFIASNNNLVALADNGADSGININILSLPDKAIVNSFHFANGIFTKKEHKENVEWSPDTNYLSVPLKVTQTSEEEAVETNNYQHYIIEIGANESFSLNDFLGKATIRNVRWDPKEKDYLFFQSENNLYRANIRDVADTALVATDVSSYDLSASGVFFTQLPNELVYKTALDNPSDKTQLTSDFPEKLNKSIEKIIVYDNDRIAFLDGDKNLFVFNHGEHDQYFRKLSSDVEGMQFSDDGKKLLFWTNNEISVYFLRDWNVQPIRVENEVNNITRYSTKIDNIQWLKDYEHVIFSTGKTLKIIELDPRDHYNIMDILSANIDTPLAIYNHSLENLFFIDKKGEVSDLYSIIFPEATTILGF